MSTTDKAQQKLVDSMRKTKARSGATPAATKKAQVSKPPASRAKKKVSASRVSGASARPAALTDRRIGVGPYQASPRVWPD